MKQRMLLVPFPALSPHGRHEGMQDMQAASHGVAWQWVSATLPDFWLRARRGAFRLVVVFVWFIVKQVHIH
jgi:hypothetical protein